MKLLSVIDNYIELNYRYMKLVKIIDSSSNSYKYAIAKGDIAYSEGDYKSESSYNYSAEKSKKEIEFAKKELYQLEGLLANVDQTYRDLINGMTITELNDAILFLSEKKDETDKEIERYNQKRKWALEKGDEAYANKKFVEEQEYNTIVSDCRTKGDMLNHFSSNYQSFINDIRDVLHKKADEKSGIKR